MASPDSFLRVSQLELKFRFELKKSIPVVLTLANPTDKRVAFKVKTTAPKKYCVKPSSGFVEPYATRDVQVVMQPQREYPASFVDCKDKFLIQSVVAVGTEKEVTSDMFDPSRPWEIRQIKLRVQLLGPPKPPSPVPEGVEEPLSPNQQTPVHKQQTDTWSLKEQVMTSAAADKAEIKRRLDSLEGHSKGGQPQSTAGGGTVRATPPFKGFSLLHLLVVALLAFLVGRAVNEISLYFSRAEYLRDD